MARDRSIYTVCLKKTRQHWQAVVSTTQTNFDIFAKQHQLAHLRK